MSPETPPKDRVLASDDPKLHPGWGLIEFLITLGADEFALNFIYIGDDTDECDRLIEKVAFASLGQRMGECTSTGQFQSNPRSVAVWRLDRESLAALGEVMPDGVLGLDEAYLTARAWAEDLRVYRRGELLFGTVSHEKEAFLRLSDDEWAQWERQAAGD